MKTDGDVRIWVNSAPQSIVEALRSVPLMNELCRFRNAMFQTPGIYDGAMSEDCKRRMREQYHAMDEFIKALREIQ